jgi:hypothetical protein
MDQSSICLYLNRKGLSAQAIHDQLVQIFGADAIACSKMTFYLRQSQSMAKNEEPHSDRPPDVIDNAILRALNQSLFASVRELAKSICLRTITVWRRLTRSL